MAGPWFGYNLMAHHGSSDSGTPTTARASQVNDIQCEAIAQASDLAIAVYTFQEALDAIIIMIYPYPFPCTLPSLKPTWSGVPLHFDEGMKCRV